MTAAWVYESVSDISNTIWMSAVEPGTWVVCRENPAVNLAPCRLGFL